VADSKECMSLKTTDSRAHADGVDENPRPVARLSEHQLGAGEPQALGLPVTDEIESVQRALTEAFDTSTAPS